MKSMEEDGQKHMTIMDSGSVRSYQMPVSLPALITR